MSNLLTADQVGEILNLDPETIRNYARLAELDTAPLAARRGRFSISTLPLHLQVK